MDDDSQSCDHRAVVVCRGTTKVFGEGESRVAALRGVDLNIYEGELTLLVGPSGCGKTTLISVIVGILDATEGSVTAFGADLTRMSRRDQTRFRRDRVGFVFQQFNLLPALTAVENAAVPLVIAGQSRREAIEKATENLRLVGLGSRLHALPSQLSGGEQQRVAITRALVHDPDLVVCDEPTSSLDAQSGQTIMKLLRKFAVRSGRAVVVVTHDARVFEFGDRIAYMEDGRVPRVDVQTRSQHRESE